jgi:STE24 endopeptidase
MKTMHPLLDPEKQSQARQYEKEKRRLGLAGMLLAFLVLLGYYFSGLSSRTAVLFPESSFLWAFLVYGAGFLTALTAIGLPLNFYSGYLHEHKWKFSNHTMKTWFWDQCKSFLVTLTVLYIVLGLLLWVMDRFPDHWWLIAAAALTLVSVIFATILPVVILPIFNKYTPIEDEALTGALEKILARGGLRSSGFFKEDMSRQTKKENAFLAGLGKTRRVVLADNLMANMEKPEIESIIAHEVGHYRHRHIWKNILFGTLQQVLVFFLLDQAMRRSFPEFPSSLRENLDLLPLMAILIGLMSGFIFGPLGQALSRSFERQADAYALAAIADPMSFQTALAGLADRNLSNAYPAWWVKILYYSHPPIGERLEMAERF